MVHWPSRILGARCVFSVLLPAAVAVIASETLLAAALNDTGQTGCYDVTGVAQSCSSDVQDGRYGRDAAAAAGALTKIGAGAAGFDFSKIANNGTVLGAGAALGPNPGDWACTRDNVTDLIWEIKTSSSSDLRYEYNAYTWYSTAANNGGATGSQGFDSCNGSLGTQCNTLNYAATVNAATLCGHSDWRLPTIKELESIKHFGAGDPAIDTNYFPNTVSEPYSAVYWTADTYAAAPTDAWIENFSGGQSGNTSSTSTDKGAVIFVRLVRSGGGP